jgi:hypothetical protein
LAVAAFVFLLNGFLWPYMFGITGIFPRTGLGNRAPVTGWFFRSANQSAELHHSGIECGRYSRFWQQGSHIFKVLGRPWWTLVCIAKAMAGNDATNVGIDHGLVLSECEDRYCPRGIGANSWKVKQVLHVGRNLAFVLLDDGHGTRM